MHCFNSSRRKANVDKMLDVSQNEREEGKNNFRKDM